MLNPLSQSKVISFGYVVFRPLAEPFVGTGSWPQSLAACKGIRLIVKNVVDDYSIHKHLAWLTSRQTWSSYFINALFLSAWILGLIISTSLLASVALFVVKNFVELMVVFTCLLDKTSSNK